MASQASSSNTTAGQPAHRPTIMGTQHVIAAGHHLAAQAGLEILEAGGNAIDAGIAAGIALCVLETDTVNFGGVAPLMIYLAEKREIHCIDGVGVWPKAITPDYFQLYHEGKMPGGAVCSVVPAGPDAWITALDRFGTMTFGEVAAAAIRLARDGFPMFPMMSDFLKANRASYARWPTNKKAYFPRGRAPEPGEVFVQAELGGTLQYLADAEKASRRKGRRVALRAARDAFYKGDVAAAIVKYHKHNGGLMSMEDFAEFSVKFEPTVKTKFRGIEIHACGPWSQGPVLPLALNILEGYELKAMGHNETEYIHVVTEALKLAFADRHQHFGDPNFVNVPVKSLMSKTYTLHRRSMIRPDRAWAEMPPAGDPVTLSDLPHRWMPPPRPDHEEGPSGPGGETTNVCCVDRHRNAFSATPSDASNGSPLIPGVGIVCSGRGTQSWVDPAHPSSVAPGKRPRLTPSPAIALKNGKLLMPFGTPGGDVQPQTMLQVFLNINVFGMDPQRAVEAPRFVGYSYPNSSRSHLYCPGRVYLEDRIAKETGDKLAQLGHKVYWWDGWNPLCGGANVIVADHKNGVLHGGADPRRCAYAVGR